LIVPVLALAAPLPGRAEASGKPKTNWPISESKPAVGQNKRLEPYAGKRVTVSGNVYTRGGSNASVIEKIAAAARQ